MHIYLLRETRALPSQPPPDDVICEHSLKITLTSDQQFPQVEETFTSRTRYLIIFSCATSTKLWRPANLEMDLLDSARVIQYAEEIYTGPDFKAAMSKGRLTESPFVNRVCCAIKKDLQTKFPNFSLRGFFTWSQSILEAFKLEEWIKLIKKFWQFLRDPGPE